jgi:hypothetical protein
VAPLPLRVRLQRTLRLREASRGFWPARTMNMGLTSTIPLMPVRSRVSLTAPWVRFAMT